MNRLTLLVSVLLGGMCLQAQTTSSTITISTVPAGPKFYVDGQQYTQAASFVWPTGSKHSLSFATDPPAPGQTTPTFTQTSFDGGTIWGFAGWVDNAGLLIPSGDPNQTITADPRIKTIKATVTISYRVVLNYFASPDPTLPASCGAPGAIPPGQFRPGIVYVGSQCFWASATIYVAGNSALTLNAFPYPGFVFLGWYMNGGTNTTYLTSITVNGQLSIEPVFTPAKRVHFLTDPLQLNVSIDHTSTPTRSTMDVSGQCPQNESQAVSPQTGFPPLCYGDVDLAPGSTHIITGVSPQIDIHSKTWVFSSWSNGLGPNGIYTADTNTATADTLVGKFVPGATIGFLTTPNGLKLTVDGTQNWPGYNFVWGLGTTHTVAAPATQVDKGGRQYSFQSWSNGGQGSQTYTVDQNAVDNGMHLTATYSVLSRLTIQSIPPGVTLQVDGASCTAPCIVDRPSGSKIHVVATPSIPQGDGVRLDYSSWSDGGAADHSYTISTDLANIWVSYQIMDRLSGSSNPANGATLAYSPTSPDMFYPDGTQVTVTATANGGFKFRRWSGALSTTFPSGIVTMSGAQSVVAGMDTVPYVAPAGITNAVGATPSTSVAPGSIISIFGQNLAPEVALGRVNPLQQSIEDVTVTVNDYLLPLLFVSPTQINAQLPSEIAAGTYTLQVHSAGQPDVSGTFTVTRDAPGLFYQTLNAQQYAIAFHADGSLITPDSPAKGGETITMLGTGFGPYSGNVLDGFFPPNPAPSTMDPVAVSAGGQTPQMMSSGAATGYTGLTLTKFVVPGGMASGSNIPVMVTVNGTQSNTVMLPIQ